MAPRPGGERGERGRGSACGRPQAAASPAPPADLSLPPYPRSRFRRTAPLAVPPHRAVHSPFTLSFPPRTCRPRPAPAGQRRNSSVDFPSPSSRYSFTPAASVASRGQLGERWRPPPVATLTPISLPARAVACSLARERRGDESSSNNRRRFADHRYCPSIPVTGDTPPAASLSETRAPGRALRPRLQAPRLPPG